MAGRQGGRDIGESQMLERVDEVKRRGKDLRFERAAGETKELGFVG